MGFTEIAFEDIPKWSSARPRMKKVFRAALRERELVGQILALSRKSDGTHTLISVKPLISETLALLHVSTPEGIEIKVQAAADNDAVSANRSALEQVIMNLVMNAIQAVTPRRGVIEINFEEKNFSDGKGCQIRRCTLAGIWRSRSGITDRA
jgi:signal transduction histidine kinase